jgi:predicted Zn-dependent peptidase
VLDVVNEILAGGRTGTIYKELVRDRKLALAAGAASSFPAGKYPNLFLLYIAPNMGKSLEECETALDGVVNRLKTEKVDDETLKRVKTKVRASIIRRLDSNAGLAEQLNFYYVNYGDWRKLFTQLDEYDKINADDVMRVAKKYFIPQTRTVARLTIPEPPPNGETSTGGSNGVKK